MISYRIVVVSRMIKAALVLALRLIKIQVS